MLRTPFSLLFPLTAALLLTACGPADQPQAMAVGEPPAEAVVEISQPVAPPPAPTVEQTAPPVTAAAAPPGLPGALLPTISVATLMKDTINPSARGLWRAVSYVVTAEGASETKPETEEDWQKLREQADALVKAGATLMLPGMRANDDLNARRENYQYSTAEVERLMVQNRIEWNDYAKNMQTATFRLLYAIDQRDVQAFTEAGPALNQVCETCHAQFWYRQPGAQ